LEIISKIIFSNSMYGMHTMDMLDNNPNHQINS